MGTILKAILGAVASFFLDLLRDKRAAEAQTDKGRAEVRAETEAQARAIQQDVTDAIADPVQGRGELVDRARRNGL